MDCPHSVLDCPGHVHGLSRDTFLTLPYLLFSYLLLTYLYLPILGLPGGNRLVYQAVYQASSAGETGDECALVLLDEAGGLAEIPVSLPQNGQLGAGLPLPVCVVGLPGGNNLVFLLPDGSLQPALHLRGLIAGIVPALILKTPLVLRTKLGQLCAGVLRGGHTHDDAKGGVATVQSADAALEAVVQGLVFPVGVLLALDGLMVGGAVGVGGNLPSVAAKVIVRTLGYLLLHQAQAAHTSHVQAGQHHSDGGVEL